MFIWRVGNYRQSKDISLVHLFHHTAVETTLALTIYDSMAFAVALAINYSNDSTTPHDLKIISCRISLCYKTYWAMKAVASLMNLHEIDVCYIDITSCSLPFLHTGVATYTWQFER